jgi:hypothetical protein
MRWGDLAQITRLAETPKPTRHGTNMVGPRQRPGSLAPRGPEQVRLGKCESASFPDADAANFDDSYRSPPSAALATVPIGCAWLA